MFFVYYPVKNKVAKTKQLITEINVAPSSHRKGISAWRVHSVLHKPFSLYPQGSFDLLMTFRL